MKYKLLVLIIFALSACHNPHARIRYSVESCFGSNRETILVYEKGDSSLVKLMVNDKFVKRTMVGNEKLAELDSFYYQIQNLSSEGFSTTYEYYQVELRGRKIERTFAGSHPSFASLKHSLLGIEK